MAGSFIRLSTPTAGSRCRSDLLPIHNLPADRRPGLIAICENLGVTKAATYLIAAH